MTCPSQYTENHAACVECIFSLICKDQFETQAHQRMQAEYDSRFDVVHSV